MSLLVLEIIGSFHYLRKCLKLQTQIIVLSEHRCSVDKGMASLLEAQKPKCFTRENHRPVETGFLCPSQLINRAVKGKGVLEFKVE